MHHQNILRSAVVLLGTVLSSHAAPPTPPAGFLWQAISQETKTGSLNLNVLSVAASITSTGASGTNTSTDSETLNTTLSALFPVNPGSPSVGDIWYEFASESNTIDFAISGNVNSTKTGANWDMSFTYGLTYPGGTYTGPTPPDPLAGPHTIAFSGSVSDDPALINLGQLSGSNQVTLTTTVNTIFGSGSASHSATATSTLAASGSLNVNQTYDRWQLVPIPEPGLGMLLAALACPLLSRRRRGREN